MAAANKAGKAPDAPEDGAKPGTEYGEPSPELSYNADEQAGKREAAVITIGEVEFHRRKKNWAVTRELRTIMRGQERAQIKSARISREMAELPLDEESDERFVSLAKEQDSYQDQADDSAFMIVALLLKDEAGESPGIEHLKEHLDIEDVAMLAATLSGGGEPDPTPATPST